MLSELRSAKFHVLRGVEGLSGHRRAVVGFAQASRLAELSFADVLDESAGRGYQRRFSNEHSLDFRRYIQTQGSTTPPLTFNLRPRIDGAWRIRKHGTCVEILIARDVGAVLSQVDCQHRLGHLRDLYVVLPFMIFLGLTEHEELEIFNTINSKAKGLSSSLLDYHESKLLTDLAGQKPELFIALHLNNSSDSPWHKQLDLGGNGTTGMTRRASLRTMQKAIKRFIAACDPLRLESAPDVAVLVQEYWNAVSTVLASSWAKPRNHFLTKGIGVYALMGILADLWTDLRNSGLAPHRKNFAALLSDFAPDFDWSKHGPLRGLGGESGAKEALAVLRRARQAARARLVGVRNGQ